MKIFYILIDCIAILTLLFELKTPQEIVCRNFTSLSSSVALTHLFESAELHNNSLDHNVGITTINYNDFFITDTADLFKGRTA